MILALLTAIVCAVAIGLLIWGAYQTFVKGDVDFTKLYPGYSIDKRHYSIIERDLKELSEVVVIADTIEKPDLLLLDAVRDNLLEGVDYHFFYSSTSADHVKNNVSKHFANILQSVKDLDTESKLGEIHFNTIGFDRGNDYPYTFCLHGKREENNGTRRVLAFRGNTKGSGVSDSYEIVEQNVARTILNQARALVRDDKSFEWANTDDLDYENSIQQGMVISRGYDNVVPLKSKA